MLGRYAVVGGVVEGHLYSCEWRGGSRLCLVKSYPKDGRKMSEVCLGLVNDHWTPPGSGPTLMKGERISQHAEKYIQTLFTWRRTSDRTPNMPCTPKWLAGLKVK